MEFTLKSSDKKNKNTNQKMVSIPSNLMTEVINLLSNVECTCVWSDRDNEYLKVNDIPESLVSDLEMYNKISSFAK